MTQYRKTFITQPKHIVFSSNKKVLKAYLIGSGFIISEKKKIVFCFGCGPWGPQFCKVGPKNSNFRGFGEIFSELLDSN